MRLLETPSPGRSDRHRLPRLMPGGSSPQALGKSQHVDGAVDAGLSSFAPDRGGSEWAMLDKQDYRFGRPRCKSGKAYVVPG